ncbi:MAG: hypothetical protein WBW92_04195 [Rhodanobacteraceae bacterium]
MKIRSLSILMSCAIAIPIANASELDDAVKYGNLLTEAVEAGRSVDLRKLADHREIEQYLSHHACSEFKYKAYVVDSVGESFLYLVASKGPDVIVGRHFKMPIRNGSIEVAEVESSTRGCLDLGSPGPDTAGMVVTHLKPYPNEFHVLESNLASVSLYVATSRGTYGVQYGAIHLVRKR